jgi:hypothetical protein
MLRTSFKGARKSSFCLSFNHFITFVLFLYAILKIYAVSFIIVSQALLNHEVRPNEFISACDTLTNDTAYIFKMADKNKTNVRR